MSNQVPVHVPFPPVSSARSLFDLGIQRLTRRKPNKSYHRICEINSFKSGHFLVIGCLKGLLDRLVKSESLNFNARACIDQSRGEVNLSFRLVCLRVGYANFAANWIDNSEFKLIIFILLIHSWETRILRQIELLHYIILFLILRVFFLVILRHFNFVIFFVVIFRGTLISRFFPGHIYIAKQKWIFGFWKSRKPESRLFFIQCVNIFLQTSFIPMYVFIHVLSVRK